MSKKNNPIEFGIFKEIIKRFSNIASIDEITNSLETTIPRRTIQRKLALLVKEGKLISEGQARARRYRLPEEKEDLPTDVLVKNVLKDIVPLSSEAKVIQAKIKGPITARPYVSYNREFLDSYRPNHTYYLTESTRLHLLDIGHSPDGKLPAGTYAKQILHRLLIDLSWNSSRLEGNTYSLIETERLLEVGVISEGKDAKEAQMILNHKAAIEFLVESAEDVDINRYTILNLHALLSHNLIANSKACGNLRTIPVGISKTVYRPSEVPSLIDECFQQILNKARSIENAFEQAFFLMVHLPYLQPFEDVNKRVSRLAANLPLIRENLCPLSFVDVPQEIYVNGLLGVYELNRIELMRDVFVWAYERSSSLYSATRKALGEPDLFRLRYRDRIKDTIIKIVRNCMDKLQAVETIKQEASQQIYQADQARFIEVVETEIMSLHEGNIARYQLRRSEFQAWQERWL